MNQRQAIALRLRWSSAHLRSALTLPNVDKTNNSYIDVPPLSSSRLKLPLPDRSKALRANFTWSLKSCPFWPFSVTFCLLQISSNSSNPIPASFDPPRSSRYSWICFVVGFFPADRKASASLSTGSWESASTKILKASFRPSFSSTNVTGLENCLVIFYVLVFFVYHWVLNYLYSWYGWPLVLFSQFWII